LSPDLATALRNETPVAPDSLRERIALVAAAPPSGRRPFPSRRVLAVGVPAALAASAVGAAVIGLASSSSPAPESAARSVPSIESLDRAARELRASVESLDRAPPELRARLRSVAPLPAPARASELRAALPSVTPLPAPAARAKSPSPEAVIPGTNRAQDVQAYLTVLVDGTDDLSATTQRALRTTRRLGGYVVNAQYGTPEPSEGTAELRVRIPVSRVQAAVVQFSELGRILAQQVQISDLQQPLDELTRRIRRLERRARNAQGAELARIKREIAVLRRQRVEVNRRAAFATVGLDLTTHEPEKKVVPPGRLERAIDDATGVLTAELAIGAYALIVAAPILLLFAAGFAATRAYRRFADQRLLERA
jgi:hypothetical protein